MTEVSGWVHKQAPTGLVKPWKRRWFKYNAVTKTLEYKQFPEDKTLQGDIPLASWKAVVADTGVAWKGNKAVTFGLETLEPRYSQSKHPL